MLKLGKKGREWIKARKRLKEEYQEAGITRCEKCGSDWALSFHHLIKRSRSAGGEHTFKATRLLCAECHNLAEYNEEVNDKLKQIR